MERFFNTAGPMIQEDHYCIDPLTRVDWYEVQRMIRDKRYFVMHAPRQTGKTSTLRAMMHVLNKEGQYAPDIYQDLSLFLILYEITDRM